MHSTTTSTTSSPHTRIRDIPRKLRRNLQDYGLKSTAGKTLQQISSLFFLIKSYRIYSIDLTKPSRPPRPQEDLTLRLVSPDELDLIQQIENQEEWLRGLTRAKLLNGSLCLVALDGEQVAGFNLVSFGVVDMPLVRVKRHFRPDVAWSDQITVGKDHRGRGLGVTLRLAIFEELRKRGVRRLWGGTLPDNKANLALSKKVGLEVIANIRYSRVLWNHSWSVTRVRL